MGKPNKIIEINGKKYDADTGKLLSSSPAPSPKPSTVKKPLPSKPSQSIKNSGVILDGFVKRTKSRPPSSAHSSHSPHTQKSKTLMRPAVKRPTHQLTAKKSELLPAKTQTARLKRARRLEKSSLVSRFNLKGGLQGKVVKKNAPLKVVEPRNSAITRPVTREFEKAMHASSSHLQPSPKIPKKSRRRRYAIGSVAMLSLLVISGAAAYYFLPVAKVKYAGTRAGFSAGLPEYNPAGFGLDDNVSSNPGEVTLSYDSRTDDKNYKITQKPSNWNSQALLANYVIPTYGVNNYQVYESQGKTIYINDNSNATWVDGGIWYVLEGDALLTSDQLQRIVNSL